MAYKFAEAFASDQKHIIYSLFPQLLALLWKLSSVLSPTLMYKGGARTAALTAMSKAMKMELILLAAIFCEYNNGFIVLHDIKLFSCNASSSEYQRECNSCSSF